VDRQWFVRCRYPQTLTPRLNQVAPPAAANAQIAPTVPETPVTKAPSEPEQNNAPAVTADPRWCDPTILDGMKVPKFGVDWPSDDDYDNQRKECAFGGSFAHPIVDSLITQCKSKTPSLRKGRNIPTTCPPVTAVSKSAKDADNQMDVYKDEYIKYCPTHQGMWRGGYTPSMECIIQYFGRNFSPGCLCDTQTLSSLPPSACSGTTSLTLGAAAGTNLRG
jgi:hypothetical protein